MGTFSETICKHRILFPSIQHLAWLPQGRSQGKQKCGKNSDFYPNVTMLCSANGTAMVSVVCLSVTFVHPTQTVKLFGNILLPLSSYLHEYPCFTCFTMANHYCINRHYTASISTSFNHRPIGGRNTRQNSCRDPSLASV